MFKDTDVLLRKNEALESLTETAQGVSFKEAFEKIKNPHNAHTTFQGNAFEWLCKYFLQNAPRYRGTLKTVWLWNEWPDRDGRDNGIDIVAETTHGDLWAIQCKAYSPEKILHKSDIDSFLSESNQKDFTFRLVMTTACGIGPHLHRTLEKQEKPVSCLCWSDLNHEGLDWPRAIGDVVTPRPCLVLRDHQQEAIQNILGRFQNENHGQLIMACGTGKTFTAISLSQEMQSSLTLVLVPSINLITQWLKEWGRNVRCDFHTLVVCSDETVYEAKKDPTVYSTADIGIDVTTDPQKIARFLETDHVRSKIIFATYHSSDKIAEAQSKINIPFNLVICDEAHHLASNLKSDRSAVLYENKIQAHKRLFMTATPRYITGKVKKTALECDMEMASMDEPTLFGDVLYRLSFGEAIKRDLLSDYQIVVMGVSDRTAGDMIESGAFVKWDGKPYNARELAGLIGVAEAMHKYNLRKTISFHNRVETAKNFASELDTIIPKLPDNMAPKHAELLFDHISGNMPAGEREKKLDRFKKQTQDQYVLLANVRCLSEGVDVPSVDGVVFAAPRGSHIDIIQSVGRAIRRSEDKKIGTIVIPVFIKEGDDPDMIVKDSTFNVVWDTLWAMREHDEILAEQIDNVRRQMGNGRKFIDYKFWDNKIKIDLPIDIGLGHPSLINKIYTTVVERCSFSWEGYFGALQAYVEKNGHAKLPQSFVTQEGLNLGTWVIKQRSLRNKNKLDTQKATLLEKLPGWVWKIKN